MIITIVHNYVYYNVSFHCWAHQGNSFVFTGLDGRNLIMDLSAVHPHVRVGKMDNLSVLFSTITFFQIKQLILMEKFLIFRSGLTQL